MVFVIHKHFQKKQTVRLRHLYLHNNTSYGWMGYGYKRSVLRRQSRDANRNIKWSVYCQYGEYSLTFRALAVRQRETKWAKYWERGGGDFDPR